MKKYRIDYYYYTDLRDSKLIVAWNEMQALALAYSSEWVVVEGMELRIRLETSR